MSVTPPTRMATTSQTQQPLAAIILAAGSGQRMGDGVEKQFRPLAGKPVLIHSVAAFMAHPACARIIIVCASSHMENVRTILGSLADDPRVEITTGGARRQDSVRAGLALLTGETDAPDPSMLVAIHDAARPLLPAAVIDRLIAAMQGGAAAALPVMPVVDTLKTVSNAHIAGTIDRSALAAAQTPQTFHLAQIVKLHADHPEEIEITDDIQLVEADGQAVAAIAGDRKLMKLTTVEDFDILTALMSREKGSRHMIPDIRVGNGFDVHRFSDGPGPARIGGIDVPSPHGLAAHSDGDVGLHALCDAIFGALGDGDIGAHFPPSDDRWKDADSADFLLFAVERCATRKAVIQHLDLTLICETPKIGPHRDAMRQRIASIAGIPVDRVGVKATTSEKLGFTGRGEGIAAQATATLVITAPSMDHHDG
ncbi:MAG: 2-C-methyl-D-erythritol 4-phosphate cytidylyltransferase [Candidatus Puniceispirillaceae bacterium]